MHPQQQALNAQEQQIVALLRTLTESERSAIQQALTLISKRHTVLSRRPALHLVSPSSTI
jgi:hypothetical protein